MKLQDYFDENEVAKKTMKEEIQKEADDML